MTPPTLEMGGARLKAKRNEASFTSSTVNLKQTSEGLAGKCSTDVRDTGGTPGDTRRQPVSPSPLLSSRMV